MRNERKVACRFNRHAVLRDDQYFIFVRRTKFVRLENKRTDDFAYVLKTGFLEVIRKWRAAIGPSLLTSSFRR